MGYPYSYPFTYGGPLKLPWGVDEDGNPLLIAPGDLDTLGTALARLWKQYENSTQEPRPNWTKMMTVIGLVFADVNAQQKDINERRYIGSAFGDTLDEIGALVGRSRGSLASDGDYAKAIRVDAATLFSSGTRPQILEVAGNLFPNSPTIQIRDRFPAGFDLTITSLTADDIDLFVDIASDVPAAGVGAWIVTYAEGNAGGHESTRGVTDATKLAKGDSTRGGATDILASTVHARPIGS